MANKIIRFEPGAVHAERKKEKPKDVPNPAPPVEKAKPAEPIHDEPDAAEHPALQEEAPAPKVSKSLYKIAAILLAAVLVLVVLENWENLSPNNVGEWIRTKAVGLGFGDGYPASLTGSTADPGNFGSVNGNMYVVSDTALTVMNSSAKELFSARHSYNDPAVSEAGGRYLLYNMGGTGYQVETSAGTQFSGVTDCDITTGTISDSGKFALAVQPSDYASELRVYMKDGTLQYQYLFSDTYISAIALSPDGTHGAVASVVSRSGAIVSRITVLDFSKEEPVAEYESEGNLILGLMWSDINRIIAVGDTKTLVGDTKFNFEAYDYGGREVTAYCLTDARAIVSVSNYAYGGNSVLLVFRDNAEPVEAELPGRAEWISSAGSKAAALLADEVVSADLSTGVVEASCGISADTKAVAMADEGTVYLLGVKEIEKENLKVIQEEEELSPSA